MVILSLLSQEWKKNFRSQGFYKNLAVGVLLGIFFVYVLVVLLFIGFSLDEILEKAHKVLNPTEIFNGSMLYVILLGLTFRFFMQSLQTFHLPPYQILPIRRSLLINFLLIKPLITPFNYLLLFVIIPFSVQSVSKYYTDAVAIRLVLNFIIITCFNSLMAAFLKRRFGSNFLTTFCIIAILLSVFALEYFQIFSLFELSKNVFNFVIFKPYGLIVPVLAAGAAFWLNKWFFSKNYYPENFNKKIQQQKTYHLTFSFLHRYGVVGELISLELKLILRHKRTKSLLYMSGFFLFYGLLFYANPVHVQGSAMHFFQAMFLTGILMFMFGQWIISWDSSHFDSLMTKNIPIRTYLKANYYLLISFNILCFVLTTPYFYFGIQTLYMHLSAFIFNIGVNVYLLLFFSTYNTKRIDLSKTSAMNYQGTTFKSFIIVIPIMFIPFIIVGITSFFTTMTIALWTLTSLGVVGLLLQKQLISVCVKQFNNRKYALAEGFRESE